MAILVHEAFEKVLAHPRHWGAESVPLDRATGRILAEDLLADRDFPPFTRVSMDGIAIAYRDWQAGVRDFRIAGIQAAGVPPLTLQEPGDCLEIMTGAVLSHGADTVIRYEDLDLESRPGWARVAPIEVKSAQNVHPRGSDRNAGDRITPAGSPLSPAEIGVAATIGKSHLLVKTLPKIAVLSSGDELVPVDSLPLAHQVRISNAYALLSLLAAHGLPAARLHLTDDPDQIRSVLTPALREFDVLLLAGGVSKGKFDYLPALFEELGVEKIFHEVLQRPGRPFWFGALPGKTVVFAFPGNPVSSFMCTNRYFLPWFRACMGLQAVEPQYAALDAPFHFTPRLTYFLQVQTRFEPDGRRYAHPVAGKGSGDLANLADADGFLELPIDSTEFAPGQVFPYWPYR